MGRGRVRRSAGGLHAVRLPRQGLTEVFASVQASAGEEPPAVLARLEGLLRDRPDLRIVRIDAFGLLCGREPPAGAGARPVTWIGDRERSGGLVALQAHAVSGAAIEPVRMDGETAGVAFEDTHARYCFLADIRPPDASAPRAAQAQRAFERAEAALRAAGMDFSRVVRTWLYLDEILSWYAAFNAVRSAFYAERGLLQGGLPASTGVGAAARGGAAVTVGLLAVQPRSPKVRIAAVPSPLQPPAPEYGSAFSRAVEISAPDHRRLLVSGTASIGPEGRTAHASDLGAQIDRTLDAVEAILASRGMGWDNLVRAVAYFPDPADAPAFERHRARRGLPVLPLVAARCDLCREDLLFELEAEAATF